MKKIICKVEEELKLWKNLKRYVIKNMKGKTLTKNLEREIDYIIQERGSYLKNLRGER